ncbi:hypothetical protein A2753_04840 [Candidatus Uhrbacteria bacterium RIFCSPHIGHO2_01_FULL_47_11]|nr:MAG: hypothetical protein A2753_04840 [Candidatus Uhrbacteria bacterium RIFCSPHIGHO2_01_FULL_47_11]
MKKKLVPAFLILMALAFVYLRVQQMRGKPEGVVMRVGSAQVRVEIADTAEKQQQGLSDRATLPENQGMYFPMVSTARHTFWMNRMHFPLDIIWIREEKIVDISENVPYPLEGETPIAVSPKEPADAVLEVNSDFTEKYNIKIRDNARI